jgi:serine/threonine-protein kinase
MRPCPLDDTFLAFVRGALPHEHAARIEEHVGDCEECRELLSALAPIDAIDPQAATELGRGPIAADVELPAAPDRFEIDRILGMGGMGVVVAARNRALDRPVALKFLKPELARDRRARARFLQEARAAAKLEGPHVVRVFDVVDAEPAPYLVMELLEGRDLAKVLGEDGPLPIRCAVERVYEAATAVAEAHGIGIVHRDLKPANLFLSVRPGGREVLKLLDFGIAKLSGQGDAITTTGRPIGSPRYMAPEQLRDAATVGPATDVWALGTVLFELVTGRPAFPGSTFEVVCAAILSAKAPSMRAIRPEVPRALDAIVQRCLARDPAARFTDGRALAAALEPFTREEIVAGTRPVRAPLLAVAAIATVVALFAVAVRRPAHGEGDSGGSAARSVVTIASATEATGPIPEPTAPPAARTEPESESPRTPPTSAPSVQFANAPPRKERPRTKPSAAAEERGPVAEPPPPSPPARPVRPASDLDQDGLLDRK